MRITAEEPISTAKVVWERCNNGWMSGIDNAAARCSSRSCEANT